MTDYQRVVMFFAIRLQKMQYPIAKSAIKFLFLQKRKFLFLQQISLLA